jgi:UDP-N-acetylmuramate dehydrogenase
VGTAEVSDKHANFIQVDADGSADDVMQLMVEIVDRVQATYGVRLHAETRLIGFEQDLVDHVQKSPQAEGE